MQERPSELATAPLPAGYAGDSGIFFTAVANASLPMMVTDPGEHRIVFANRAFCRTTGYRPDEVVGRNCRFLQGAQTSAETVRRIRAALDRKTDVSVELLNYRKDGKPFWNALYISPVFGPDGALRYFFGSQIDATSRHDAERALAQAYRLEGLASLAGGVAHEFNNLLTVIQGNLEPLLREVVHPKTARRLERLREAAERAANLTRSMISFARRQQLEDQPVDLGPSLAALEPQLRTALGERDRLVLDVARDAPAILADPEQFRTALLNLLWNARDAMPAAGGTVRLEVRPQMACGRDETVLVVRDDGSGMSPETARRAMNPFFTTKPAGAGAGLGLSMVYGFMRQTGGRLDLVSTEGRGTTIILVFPAAVPARSLDP